MKKHTSFKSMFITALCLLFLTNNVLAKENRKRVLRFAHITDCHITDNDACKNGIKKLYSTLNTMKDKPEFIINTGDILMDSNGQTFGRVDSLWNLWDEMAKTNKIPMYYCNGNHDYWHPTGNEEVQKEVKSKNTDYNLGMYLRRTQMPGEYYSFEKKGWKFLALNSMANGRDFGKEQKEWLKSEIQKDNKEFVCVFSHVPIMSMTSFMYYIDREKDIKTVKFPAWDMHTDVKELKDLFYQNPNVKLSLSGHIHYYDMVDYLGVKYICSGGVSASWWNGELNEFANNFTIVDLYNDGSIEYKFVPFLR